MCFVCKIIWFNNKKYNKFHGMSNTKGLSVCFKIRLYIGLTPDFVPQ
jgi:hypothetical protein